MKFSQEQIEYLGHLARLELTSEEKERFSREFSPILDYVGQLKEVKQEDIEPISQITGLENVLRNDEIELSDEITKKEILDNFPSKERGFVKTKRILF